MRGSGGAAHETGERVRDALRLLLGGEVIQAVERLGVGARDRLGEAREGDRGSAFAGWREPVGHATVARHRRTPGRPRGRPASSSGRRLHARRGLPERGGGQITGYRSFA